MIMYGDINHNLLNISEWLRANKIMINTSKTKYVLYSYRGGLKFDLDIKIGCDLIEQTECVKFLGVYLNSSLNVKNHILVLSKRISRNIGIIFRIKDFLPKIVLKSLYYTLIHPFIIYALEAWFHAPNYLTNQIKILQKSLCE